MEQTAVVDILFWHFVDIVVNKDIIYMYTERPALLVVLD